MPITEETGVRAVVQGAAQYVSDSARVNAATGQMVAGVQKAARDSEVAGQSLQQVGTRMRELGSQGIFLGAALTAPSAAALVLAVNFETAMTRISTLSGIATEDIAELRDGIFEISRSSAQGPDELARGLLTITSTGKEGAEALAILEASAKASAVGLGETNEIARTITATVTAFASQGLTAAHAADVLFATVREGGAEVADVAGALGRVVGIAAQVGVSFEDVGAFIATFTRLGVGADEAVTALRGTLTTLINPSAEAAEALENAGLSMESLRQTARDKGLNEALRLILESFRGNEEALADVIPNVRALAGVLGTAGSQAEEFALVLNALENSTGDLDRAFEQTAQTNAFKLQQAIADIKREVLEASAVLLPALSQVLDVLSKVIDVIGLIPTPVVAAGIAMTGLAGIAIGLVSTLGLLVGTVFALTGAAGFAGLGAAAAGAGAGIAGAGAAAAGAAGGFAGLGAAASGAGAAIGAIAAAAAPVIAIGALVAGGIFAAAFIADRIAAEDAAAAISELERVRGLAQRAKEEPEEPAEPKRRAPVARAISAATGGLVAGENEEQRLIRLVERRKQLEEDIARIKKGEKVEERGIVGAPVQRSQRGLEVELADVNQQIAGRKPQTNLGVAAEELASLRQLRAELDQEADAFEAAGKNVAAHRLEIGKLDVQIRELEAGVRAGSAAVAESAQSDVTKLREEQTAQTEALTAAQERLNAVLGIKAPTAALAELTALQNSGTASADQLAAAQQRLNEAIGLTRPSAALQALLELQASGRATTDQLAEAQRNLADAVAASGNPRAIAAFNELREVQQDGSASAEQLEAAQRRLSLSLGLTPRVQALSEYISLLQSGTATAGQLQAAQERLNASLGGRASAALAELTRLRADASATNRELAAAELELASALGQAAANTETAAEATAAALADLVALQNSGVASSDQLAEAQLRLQQALGVTPAGTALLELNRLQESGTASADALRQAQEALNVAIAQSGNTAAITALAELTRLQQSGTATADELTAAQTRLQQALGITPAIGSFVELIQLQQAGTASAYEMRQAQAALAATLGAEGAAALATYVRLQGDASASDADRAAALGTLTAALVAASRAQQDSTGINAETKRSLDDLQRAYQQFPAIFAEREAAHRAQIAAERDATSSEDDLKAAADRVTDAEHAAADAIASVSSAAADSVGPVNDAAGAQRELARALDEVSKRKAAAQKKTAEQNRLQFLSETEALAAGPTLTEAARPTASGIDLEEQGLGSVLDQIEDDEREFYEGRRKAAEASIRSAESAARAAESAHNKAEAEAEAAQRELERAFRESVPGRTIEAINQLRNQRLQEQAEAVAREAFGLEGPSLADVIATQQRSNNVFQQVRDQLLKMGIEIPEAMLGLFDRAAAAAEEGAKKAGMRTDDLLSFFIARQIGRGQQFQNLVSVPPQVQAQLATSPAATGASGGGGTVQEVNINGPITIGAGATTSDVAHGVALAVRPAMSSL